jgi:ribonuclease VapC
LTTAVLDASALLALLRHEPGAERVAAAVRQGAAMSTVNLAEVAAFLARSGAGKAQIEADLTALQLQFLVPDQALAFEIGYLAAGTRAAGLSLGDRACLALARRLNVAALTADRKWATVAEAVGVEVQLIR